MPPVPEITQRDGGWYEDDNADVNANSSINGGVRKILRGVGTANRVVIRVSMDEFNNRAGSEDFELWVSHNDGAYSQVSGANSYVRPTAAQFTDGDACTQREDNAPSGSYANGVADDNDAVVSGYAYAKHEFFEHCYSIYIFADNVVNGDLLEFECRSTNTVGHGVRPSLVVDIPTGEALPNTITVSGTEYSIMPQTNFHLGPWRSSAEEYYFLLWDYNVELEIWKATDPEGAWAIQDAANAPAAQLDSCAGAEKVGDILHVVFAEGLAGLAGTMNYISFDMSADTWTGADLESWGAGVRSSQYASCDVKVRDGSDVIVMYNGDTESVGGSPRDRIYYSRREAGVWTHDIQLGDTGDAFNWYGSQIVKDRGGDDRMHFFFKNTSGTDSAFQQTLLGDNTLEALPAAGDSAVYATSMSHVFIHGISYDVGGTEKIRCGYYDANGKISYAYFDSVDEPGAFSVNQYVSALFVANTEHFPVAGMAVDGTDEYLIFAQSSGNDLYYDVNDGVDLEIRDGVNIVRLSVGEPYERKGVVVIPMVYQNGELIQYDEFPIRWPAAHTVSPILKSGNLINLKLVE